MKTTEEAASGTGLQFTLLEEAPSPFTEEQQTRELTREHTALHVAICTRFEELLNELDTKGTSHGNLYGDRTSRLMDLAAVHQELDIDWEKLLDAKDGDFLHDVLGIHNHMDRSTATLADCFLPRFTRPERGLPKRTGQNDPRNGS